MNNAKYFTTPCTEKYTQNTTISSTCTCRNKSHQISVKDVSVSFFYLKNEFLNIPFYDYCDNI